MVPMVVQHSPGGAAGMSHVDSGAAGALPGPSSGQRTRQTTDSARRPPNLGYNRQCRKMDKRTPAVELPDEELAAQASAGSREAFEQLVSKYTPRLFFFLRHKAGSSADLEDLVQEAFMRAFRNIERYDARWKFSTWLYTLAVRMAISRHRAQKIKPVGLDEDKPTASSPGPMEALIQKEETERRKNIWNLALTLRPSEYEALWLRYAEDMSVKDIAAAMGKSRVGVRALLHRGRLNLAEKLKEPVPSHGLAEKEERYALLNL
jgi:RNA polymerase sigma-70 factor (ECF subfamily)